MAHFLNELRAKATDAKRVTVEARTDYDAVLDAVNAAVTTGTAITDEQRATLGAARTAVRTAEAAEADADEALTLALELEARDTARLEAARATAVRRGSRIETHDNREDRPWSRPGEQLLAVARAMSPAGAFEGAGEHDPRLFRNPNGASAAASGANTTAGGTAGYLVQPDYSTAMLTRAVEAATLLPLCDSFECSENSDSLEAPYIDETSRATGSRWGGVRVYRRKEAQTVAASKPELGAFELKLEDMMAISYISGRTLQDARLIEQITMSAFAAEFSFKADDEIVRGNGAGMMSGIVDSGANTALVTQAIESGQTLANSNGGLLPANLSKMWVAMPTRYKTGSFWFYNAELGPALDALALTPGAGALEPRFVTYGPDGILRIKGRPAIELEQCSAPGTVGDIILFNPKEYVILTKGGLKTDASMHVRFLYDEMTYRFITRINGKLKWRSAVAPYKGSVSKSPTVTLNTRA